MIRLALSVDLTGFRRTFLNQNIFKKNKNNHLLVDG